MKIFRQFRYASRRIGEPIWSRFRLGYGGEPTVFGSAGCKLAQLRDGRGESSVDFVRSRITQTLGCLGEVFGRAPKADCDFKMWKVCAQLRAEIARVDDRGGCDDGNACDIGVSFINHFDQFVGEQFCWPH